MASAPDNVSCIACHAATSVTHARLTSMALEPSAITGRYESDRYDLSVTGKLPEKNVSRALGWFGDQPMISQRVVNDTAQFLAELGELFPRE